MRRRLHAVGFGQPGAPIVLLGDDPHEFGGLGVGPGRRTGTSAGARQPWTWPRSRRSPGCSTAAAAEGLLTAAHDLSDGGLAVALAECCLAGGTGCQVSLPGDPFTALFSESSARAVAAVTPGAGAAFAARCERHGVPVTELGTVGGGQLEVTGCFSVPVTELAEVRERVLPALFG